MCNVEKLDEEIDFENKMQEDFEKELEDDFFSMIEEME